MRYGLAVAGDARIDLRAMDIWLQEAFWDELERIAVDPSILVAAGSGDEFLHKFSKESGGVRHFITLTIGRNDFSRTITVLGITDDQEFIRP